MADLQQVIDVLNIHNKERRDTEELQIGRDIDNNILMQNTNSMLSEINDSIHRLGMVLAGSNQALIDQLESDFKSMRSLEDARTANDKALLDQMGKDFGSLLKIEEKRDKASQLVREKADRPVRPKRVKERSPGMGNLFGAAGSTAFGLGKLTAVGLPLIALASELWLELRGLGSGFSELRDRIASIASAVWVIGGKVLKYTPLFGRLLKFIPGLGQFVTLATSFFSGIRDAVQTYMQTGDIGESIKAGLSGALSAFINGFIGIFDLFGYDTSELRGNVETAVTQFVDFIVDLVVGTMNTLVRIAGQLKDLFTTSDIESERAAAEADEARMQSRRNRLARKRRRTAEEQAELEALEEALPEARRRAEIAVLRGRMEDAGYDMTSDRYSQRELMTMTDEELAAAGLMETYNTRQGNLAYRIKKRGALRENPKPSVELGITDANTITSAVVAADEARMGRENNRGVTGVALDQSRTVIDNSSNSNFHAGNDLPATNAMIGPA